MGRVLLSHVRSIFERVASGVNVLRILTSSRYQVLCSETLILAYEEYNIDVNVCFPLKISEVVSSRCTPFIAFESSRDVRPYGHACAVLGQGFL